MPYLSCLSLTVRAIVLLGRAGTATWPLGLDSFLPDNLIFPVGGKKQNKTKHRGGGRSRDSWVL